MGREIKFRAWHFKKKRWIDPDAIYFTRSDLPLGSLLLGYHDGNERVHGIANGPIADMILEQFTDLRDKNGKEIYEGDILKIVIVGGEEKYNPQEALTAVVEHRNAAFGFVHTHPGMVHADDRRWKSFWQDDEDRMWNPDYFEVIGNIRENQELLK